MTDFLPATAPVSSGDIVDLHTHSTASDGSLTPADLVNRAFDKGVRTLALTDHDTVAGIAAARQAAEANGMELIPGIEFSAQWQGINIHVVGLRIEVSHPAILDSVISQAQVRLDRLGLIAERLEKRGIPGVLAGTLALAGDAVPGRPHIAKYLLDGGWVKSEQEAFKRFLGAGKVGDVKQLWPDLATVIRWVHEAGGVAVLAHPDKYRMTGAKLERLVLAFSLMGGDAIELAAEQRQRQKTPQLKRLCQRYELAASVGSDFHSPDASWTDVGRVDPLPAGVVPVWSLWD